MKTKRIFNKELSEEDIAEIEPDVYSVIEDLYRHSVRLVFNCGLYPVAGKPNTYYVIEWSDVELIVEHLSTCVP